MRSETILPSIEPQAEPGQRHQAPRLEEMARALEATGDYRIVRRIPKRTAIAMPDHRLHRVAIFVDVETTGLDAASDEIIEIGILPFSYDMNDRIVATHRQFCAFREPSGPIPTAITTLTGIDDEMVRGTSIRPSDLEPFLDRVSLVVAHNAPFDRAFLEAAFPVFADLPWACSLGDVPWKANGVRQSSLECVAASFGFFYRAHRAIDDCHAAVEILDQSLACSSTTVLGAMLENARRPTFRVWAIGAPYEVRTALKGRGYRWHDGARGGPRSWYRDVRAREVDDELAYLDDLYDARVDIPVVRIDAFARHSDRSWKVPYEG